jgi:hypothetical protein
VDYVRKSAWAIYQWQERQFKKKDAWTVLSPLTTERVRRATQLNDAIVADFDAAQLNPETPGIAEFAQAVGRIRQRLKDLGINPARMKWPGCLQAEPSNAAIAASSSRRRGFRRRSPRGGKRRGRYRSVLVTWPELLPGAHCFGSPQVKLAASAVSPVPL